MPRIENITPALYGPNDPIHWEIDNIPLKVLIQRQELINLALDDVIEQMRDAIGSSGSVANRLNQSLEGDGSLKTLAIDDASHSIESHTDSDDYVRMTKEQSDKLDLIDDEANNIEIAVADGSSVVTFNTGSINIIESNSVSPRITGSNDLSFDLSFPEESAHQHFYNLEPIHANLVTPDYQNYTTPSAVPFIDGSLRVYINGVRVNETASYVPGYLVDDPWMLQSFTSTPASGTFELSAPIADEDVIIIDFDIILT